MTTTAQMPGQLTGNVLFYSKPEPLAKELHSKLGLKRMDGPFKFAKVGHAVRRRVHRDAAELVDRGKQVEHLCGAEIGQVHLCFPAGDRDGHAARPVERDDDRQRELAVLLPEFH